MSDTNVHRVVGNLLVGTSHFFVDTTTNQVGINTSSPSASLDVATGDVKVGSGITLANNGTITATGGFSGDGSLLENVPGDSGSWVKDDTNGLIYVANLAHKVGIGKDNPSYMLDVNGDINIPSGSTLRVGGTPAVFSNWSVNGSDISRSSGNVGIGGAASGTDRLKVHGTVEATALSVGGTDISSTYATQSALTNGLAGKQASGSYASINGSSSQDFYAKENYAQNWFRVQGNGGIYWTQHGGGWYMNDSTWVRIYNGKSLWGGNGTIGTDGKMGIGTSNPYTKLHIIGGSGGHYTATGSFFVSGWNNIQSSYGAQYGAMSIWATDDIISKGYIGTSSGTVNSSDRRIKKDILDVNDDSALQQLRLIKPKTYKYIDYIDKGDTPVYGFIAQEVRETIPEATQLRSECIPNIYEFTRVSDTNIITFTTFNTTDLTTNTSTIEIRGKDNSPREVKIVEVMGDHTVRVDTDLTEWCGDVDENGELIEGNGIFVYGEKVDDFVFLKKDYIFTIATAALQEVDRQLQTTRTELTETKTDLEERLNTHTHPLEEHTHPLEEHTHPLEKHTHPDLVDQLTIEKAKTHELQQRLTLIEHSHAALVARLEALENI